MSASSSCSGSAGSPRASCCGARRREPSEVVRQGVVAAGAVAVVVLGCGPDVDVVDPPLVVLLAQHDAVADAVFVPAQLGAIVAELIDAIVDPLADARDEALDLPGQAIAAAL